MKKKHNIFLLVLVSILIILCSAKVFSQKFTLLEERDFRKTIWGMSREQVKFIEEEKLIHEDENTLLYEAKIDKFNCYSCYYFLENTLYRSAYIFNEEHNNKNAYIEDYENIKELLIKKYGKQNWENIDWKDDFYKDIRGNWGLAVARGDLKYVITWETSTTMIQMRLTGENYKINLTIVYYSEELEDWAKEILDRKSIKDL